MFSLIRNLGPPEGQTLGFSFFRLLLTAHGEEGEVDGIQPFGEIRVFAILS